MTEAEDTLWIISSSRKNLKWCQEVLGSELLGFLEQVSQQSKLLSVRDGCRGVLDGRVDFLKYLLAIWLPQIYAGYECRSKGRYTQRA